jgi:hypothetical protein
MNGATDFQMTNQPTPPLFDDVKAIERFPYAAAASRFHSPRAREVFVNRAACDNHSISPYETLRTLRP